MKNKELLQFSIQPQNSNQVQGKLFNWLSLSSVAQLDRIRIRPFMGWFYIKNELRVVILQACTLYIVQCTYSIYKYKTKEFLQNFIFLFDSKLSIKSWQNGVVTWFQIRIKMKIGIRIRIKLFRIRLLYRSRKLLYYNRRGFVNCNCNYKSLNLLKYLLFPTVIANLFIWQVYIHILY